MKKGGTAFDRSPFLGAPWLLLLCGRGVITVTNIRFFFQHVNRESMLSAPCIAPQDGKDVSLSGVLFQLSAGYHHSVY